MADTNKKLWSFLIAIIFCLDVVNAQQYNFKHYTVLNGLGSSSVNNIFQDKRGYIWFATQGGGVSRFDGKEFRVFNKENGLICNDVTFITEDKQGSLWVATAQGASQFDGSKFRNYGLKEGLTDGVVYAIFVDNKGQVWFALKEGGIKILSQGHFESLSVKDGLPSTEVYSVIQNLKGEYWIGLSNGIAKYDGKNVTGFGQLSFVKGNTFFSAMLDGGGNIWFGSTAGKVVKITNSDSLFNFQLPAEFRKDFIGSIARDRWQNIWFATDHGLLKYSNQTFTSYTDKEGLSANSVQAISIDDENNIWIGTLGGGVNMLHSEAFVTYTQKDGLKTGNITCIVPIPNGNGKCYVGTAGAGVYILDKGATPRFKKIDGVEEISKINVSSVATGPDGIIRVSAQEGIFELKAEGRGYMLLAQHQAFNNQSIVSATQILDDKQGNCWIATYGSGIFLLHGNQVIHYGLKNGLGSDNVLSVFQDDKGNIWAGTQDAGAWKYDGNKFNSFKGDTTLTNKAVWAIAEDSAGNIFFGTGENGLGVFDGIKLVYYGKDSGFFSNYINSLYWDKFRNCLWIGSESGIGRVRLNHGKVVTIEAFNESVGFSAFGVNQNSIFAGDSNFVWFGSINGLWCYDYHQDQRTPIFPKLQFAEIRLANRIVDWHIYCDSVDKFSHLPVGLILPYNENHLTFSIRALTTSTVKYSYKLEGADKDWSPWDVNNQVNYSNIEPGKEYTFIARALTTEGTQSADTLKFHFYIGLPWWRTWWFIFLLAIIITLLIFLFVKGRESLLKEQNIALEKTVGQRTAEISTQKNLVEEALKEKEILLGEKEVLLKEIHHRVKNNLQTISSLLMLQSIGMQDEHAKKAIVESQNRVRSIALVHQRLYQSNGLEKVEFNGFVAELAVQIQSVFQQTDVAVLWDIPETYLLIDMAVPLGLILNELLTNSFKYAFKAHGKGVIKMKLTCMDGMAENTGIKQMEFIYWDSGPGLSESLGKMPGSTLGLKLIKLLSRQIDATMCYRKEEGSEFTFVFNMHI